LNALKVSEFSQANAAMLTGGWMLLREHKKNYVPSTKKWLAGPRGGVFQYGGIKLTQDNLSKLTLQQTTYLLLPLTPPTQTIK
jgi:hypothetical protein